MVNLKKLEEVARALEPIHRNEQRCFHVATIARGNKIISIAHNKKISHPKTKEYNYHHLSGAHAEMLSCIRGGREDYTKHTMYVLRIDMNGNLNTSKPCKYCAALIKQLNFKKVYYTNQIGEWESY